MRVFIAGKNGMAGSSILRNAPKNHEVLAPARSELDLIDEEAVSSYFAKNQFDAVILAAAKVGGISANANNQREFLYTNIELQNSVINATFKNEIPKLIFLGSSCIYPRDAKQPITEDSLLTGPLEITNEGYALAKITGIRLCQAISIEKGFDYFSLMPTNLYGPNDNFHPEHSHVPAALMRRFHEAKIAGIKKVAVWGTGKPRREFMHVDDLARACWELLDKVKGGELLNVGTGEDQTISEFAHLMAKTVGYEGEIEFETSRPDGTPRKLLDVSRIHSYGWHHSIDLLKGLEETYRWFVSALAKGGVRGY